ncbi:hypothetical protein ACH6EH_11340 [Paenibacillus sp. JSM ZJ436]|uniref:Transposase IS4 family protein n=1 Tax=Paenibacillus algicola TaxID=2565926 RepID=A0A4P8XMJ6_9BACL|nr:transposase IS4 family protein [Paenibacillus algicola]
MTKQAPVHVHDGEMAPDLIKTVTAENDVQFFMLDAGYDQKKAKKLRCPHATGKVDCPLGMTAYSSSNYGMVVKIDVKDDLKRYSSPHRDTKR